MEFASNIDRKHRRQNTGEDFTPKLLVETMLDKLPAEIFAGNHNFLDNSAGNGNFVIAIIERKIKAGMSYIDALKTTYAIELMPDNVQEMKNRIKMLVLSVCEDADQKKVDKIINTNIVCGNLFDWDCEKWKPKNTGTQLKLDF